MDYKNLVFLGTSHIAKQSLMEVKNTIEKESPAIIAIELDEKRLKALTSKVRKIRLRNIKQIGLKGFLFSLFGAWVEKQLGKLVGVAPGSEMKQAIKIAKKNRINISLIDQDIEVTLKRLSEEITWSEKKNFLIDIVKALFTRSKEFEFDLNKVPDKTIIDKLISKLKERYPSLYKVLIVERNVAIANNIKKLMSNAPDRKILVILGAGHIDGVLKLVREENK